MLREAKIRSAWTGVIAAGVVGSCNPQRAEFRRSARSLDEYEQMCAMFDAIYSDVPVPKSGWQCIESAQYRLVRVGAIRSLSVADLLICATAAHYGLIVLHDDNDFGTAARHLTDLRQCRVHDFPG